MNNDGFGRISDEVFEKTKTVNALTWLMCTDKNRDGFLDRCNKFREELKANFPEFTEEELLKIDIARPRLKSMYQCIEHYQFFAVIEFELRKQKANSLKIYA